MRNLEDPSTAAGTASESPSRINQIVSRSAAQKLKVQPSSGSAKCKKPSSTTKVTERLMNGHHVDSSSIKSKHESRVPNAAAAANNEEKVSVEVIEWPKIYIALSRKEKEDDFLAMKGTKISQRPKKRAKNIDRTLQYCFPGMWLSDLTKSRYEVREKKSVKKQKRCRGLKGMESLESDSE
uniref:Uncharacterized protein LOC101492134 isoform X2 n=1 Tax=Cicer arietinum TaxID=3827 RepID=A0A1S3EFQ7_CICAR|nr:uncharacterized protein LOC101492134 isoform X2 [Cicer arietinum]